mgnify:CR=1 FL=1|jgi:hypothetical protein
MQLHMLLMTALLAIGQVALAIGDSTLPKTGRTSCSCAFSSINQGGVMRGEAGSYFQFQTINGIQYKTWFAGLGVGLDLYPADGLPVFLDVRRYFLNGRYNPFVYAEAGIHFADKNNEETNWQRDDYSNDLFYDVGVGIKIGFMKKGSLLLSGGYSFKKYDKKIISIVPGCMVFPCHEGLQVHSYRLNRLSLKLGFQF